MRIVACPSEHLTVVPASFRNPAIALADTFVGMNGSPMSEPCVYSVVSRTIVTPARLGIPLWVGERSGESGERVPVPCLHQRRSTDSQDRFHLHQRRSTDSQDISMNKKLFDSHAHCARKPHPPF